MKASDQYRKIVEWSEKDQCYVGLCPELAYNGVHGDDEVKVFAELCKAIDEVVADAEKRNETLPQGLAGKFNLGIDKGLYERLERQAAEEHKSLDDYCAELLDKHFDSEQAGKPPKGLSQETRKSDQYRKIVEWSEEDQCYVGRCPELAYGGVHGDDQVKVFAELCEVIDEWIAVAEEHNESLPRGLAGKRFDGEFNLRIDYAQHAELAFRAGRQNKSLNAYCAGALEKQLEKASKPRKSRPKKRPQAAAQESSQRMNPSVASPR